MTIAPRLVKPHSRGGSTALAEAHDAGCPSNFPGQNSSPHYLDVGDNVHANVCSWLDVNCGDSENKWFIPGTCTGYGHRYAKTIYCGKEWCPVCGVKGSASHNRRFVRWLSKIRQFTKMQYLVLTIPENIRVKYRTKESLKELGRSAQILMIKHGYKRGLRRWHWFGDESNKWNPHLNILVEDGWIPKHKINSIKLDWANILGAAVTLDYFKNGKIKSVHGIDIKVKYKNSPSDMIGSMNYVTRPTFHDYNWDIDMAMELRNFRNMVVWGRDWKQELKWEMPVQDRTNAAGEVLDVVSIEKLMEHQCPHGDGEMIWSKALPNRILELTESLDLGAGFRYIVDGDSPGGLEESVKDRLRTMRLANIAKAMGAVDFDKPVKRKGYIRYNPLYSGGKELVYYDNDS